MPQTAGMKNSPEITGPISLFLGTLFLLGSNVLGHGLGIGPDPRGALLLAASGLLLFVLAFARPTRWRDRMLPLMQFVLALGAFSVVAALVVGALREFHRLAPEDWGAIPPPQLIFGTLYALASLLALLGSSVCLRQDHEPEQEMQLAAD